MADFRADYSKFTVEDLGWNKVPFADVDKKVTDLMDFTGKTVIVTGAGGVLCAEISKGLAKAGVGCEEVAEIGVIGVLLKAGAQIGVKLGFVAR